SKRRSKRAQRSSRRTASSTRACASSPVRADARSARGRERDRLELEALALAAGENDVDELAIPVDAKRRRYVSAQILIGPADAQVVEYGVRAGARGVRRRARLVVQQVDHEQAVVFGPLRRTFEIG